MFHEIHIGAWILFPIAVVTAAFYLADWIYARKSKT
jgi:hypothetical protein